MPSDHWIKLYHEALTDPKVARLSDHLWRRFFELCLLAGEHNERDGNGEKQGFLPSVADMAWTFRTSDEDMQADLDALSEVGLLCVTTDGLWVVTNFAKRQSAMSDTERQRRHREKQRLVKYYGHASRYEPVTSPVTDAVTTRDTEVEAEEEGETEREEEGEVPDARARAGARSNGNSGQLMALLDRSGVVVASEMQSEQWVGLLEITEDMEFIGQAFEASARAGKRPSPGYIRAILERCLRDNCAPDEWPKRARASPKGNGSQAPSQDAYLEAWRNSRIGKQVLAQMKKERDDGQPVA